MVVLGFDGIEAGCKCFGGVVCGGYDGDGGILVIYTTICLFNNILIPPEALN